MNANAEGSLIIVSAPSGTGKTSLVRELLDRITSLKKSVSHTTRPKRTNEEEGKHYHFVSKDQFKKMRDQDLFLEWAEVFGNLYGTSKEWVLQTLRSGVDVILEIDWQGAQQICQQIPDAVTVFILPPSPKELADRLTTRNLDEPDVIAQRLEQAKIEVSHYNEYTYLIVNDDFQHTLNDLVHIVKAARLRTTKQAAKSRSLIDQLTAT